tara:strand:- start:38 stop:157 length:120 start_codon:yes stop_codon:yes gene_type:complete
MGKMVQVMHKLLKPSHPNFDSSYEKVLVNDIVEEDYRCP